MGKDFRTNHLERLFAQTRRALESMRSSRPGPIGADFIEFVTGETCAGKVRAVVANSRLDSLWVSPEVKHLPTGLCDHLVTAVNAALETRMPPGRRSSSTADA